MRKETRGRTQKESEIVIHFQGINRLWAYHPGAFMLIIFISLFFTTAANAVVYIDHSRSGGDGTAWERAFRSIESAIAAKGSNQEFWIAEGTYTPNSPLRPKEGSSFYGGFTGNEKYRTQRNSGSHHVSIDGLNTLNHVVHILYSDIHFDGVTIKRGSATGAGADGVGGGVLLQGGSAVFVNCSFSDNSAGSGGAVYGYDADLTFSKCIFKNNKAIHGAKRGGAIWIHKQSPMILDSTFINNSAGVMGGAVELNNTTNGLLYNSTFSNNSVGVGGGGAVSLQWSDPSTNPYVTIEKCNFNDNSSGKEGGAVYSNKVHVLIRQGNFINNTAVNGGAILLDYKIPQQSIIERCNFINNSSTKVGGAIQSYMRSLKIENSVFSFNQSYYGGAVGLDWGSDPIHEADPSYNPVLKSNTFYRNKATSTTSTGGKGGAIFNLGDHTLKIYNSIFWKNEATNNYWQDMASRTSNDIFNSRDTSVAWIEYCNMETITWPSSPVYTSVTGSFSADPKFVDPDGDDNIGGTADDNFQLMVSSPCIDSANGNQLSTPSCDYACYPRIDHSGRPNTGVGTIKYGDIGAFEFLEDPNTPKSNLCPKTTPPAFNESWTPIPKNLIPIIFLLEG